MEISAKRDYDERRQDTATKIVVTREEIVRYGDSTIADVLKRLPGITIGGVQGRGGEIRMRGLGSGYTQILLNGEPAPPGFSLDSLAPDLIERIEIMRAATAEYSTQAIAGTINIVLKKAVQTAQRDFKLGATHNYGVWSGNASLQVSDKADKLSYSLTGNLAEGRWERPSTQIESVSDAQGNLLLLRRHDDESHGRYQNLNFAPRLNWTLSDSDTLTSQSFVLHQYYSGNQPEHIWAEQGALPPYSGSLTSFDGRTDMIRSDLNWVHKIEGGAKLDVKFGANYNRSENNTYTAYTDSADTLLLDRLYFGNSTDKGFTWNGKFSTPYGEEHSLVVGWDGGYSRRDEHRVQTDLSYNGVAPIDLDQDFAAKVWRTALFAQDEWNVTPRWSVYLGLRWEGLETDAEGSDQDAVRSRYGVFSPVFQTLWKLPDSKNDQLRFALARTYKAPSTSSLLSRRYLSDNNSALYPDTQGNPKLKPELAWGLDASYEHFLADGGLLSASVYLRRISDVMRNEVLDIDGRFVSMPVNEGGATTHGLELEAKLPLKALVEGAPAIDFRANLSFNWSTLATVPGPNNRLDSQTPISANLGLDYTAAGLPLTLGGNFSFQDAGLVGISEAQSKYAVPKRELDLYGLWKFNRETQLRLTLSNLLHQDNVTAAMYADASGASRLSTVTPTGVAVKAMLEMKF